MPPFSDNAPFVSVAYISRIGKIITGSSCHSDSGQCFVNDLFHLLVMKLVSEYDRIKMMQPIIGKTRPKDSVTWLTNSSDNLNQIARRVNSSGSVYRADIEDLKANYEKVWGKAGGIPHELARL